MPAKLRTTSNSRKGPRDEPAAAATETKAPAPDHQLPSPTMLEPRARGQMIACAAYCRAEKRGFAGGAESQLHDWLEAEMEIDRMLAGTSIKR
ncbi:MAG: DUF2934 domain-containing protein [Burkholderiales bacterium]